MTAQPITQVDAAWTAADVNGALFNHFIGSGWAPLVEVSVPSEESLFETEEWKARGVTPIGAEVWERTKGRRVDMLLARRARKAGIGTVERLAIEVKVSRSDFLQDIRNPYKQAPARNLAHRHAFAVPAGLVTPDEVPDGSGLLYVRRVSNGQHTARTVEWAKRARYNDATAAETPDWLTLTFAFRAAWAEGHVKGFTLASQALGDDPDELRARVKVLTKELERAHRSKEQWRAKSEAWKTAFGAVGGLPCMHCDALVRPAGIRAGYWTKWVHVDKAAEAACELVRSVKAEAGARERWETDSANPTTADYARRYFPDEPWRYLLAVPDVLPVDPSRLDEIDDDEEPT